MSIKLHIALALNVLGFQLFLAGTFFRFVPTTAAIGPLVRVLDSLSPWFLVLALLISSLAAAFGSQRLGGAVALATLVGSAHLFLDHRSLSQPEFPDRESDIRILFFNALASNSASNEEIVSSVLATDPDIIVIAERRAIDASLERIIEAYAFVSPCEKDGCELLVASKVPPIRFWQLNLNSAWDKRYAVAEFEVVGEGSFFLASSQIAKPWLSGLSESELAKLASQYNWFDGTVVAVGDFNAAPWSFPMRQLFSSTGMRGLRVPPATWPAKAGAFGIPIDQILVRGAAWVVDIRAFGGNLGSNHRGFVADIALQ